MTYSHYERLSALDASFLEIEDENAPMHVGAVAVFGPGSLTGEGGGVDIERFRSFTESVLHPRYRQRIARMPLTGAPIWVDDPSFNLLYHVRHLSLPEPGDERQLKRLAGHVMSLALDRNRPLWELWVVEGLAEGGFAVITKAHHCMIDGVGSADLLTASMQLEPGALSDWGFGALFTQFARMSVLTRPFNLVVTNIPGPQVRAHMLGSPLEQVYPLVPLFKNQALGIALFSYNGGLYWGINSDWDVVPDLHDLVGYLAADFEALRKAAHVGVTGSVTPGP